jgi:4-amino-4-deoxy-L-arabinose transferase-like glycosyltransferase
VFETLTRSQKVAALLLIVVLGLVLRLGGLERVGFNEDEVHKVEAARAYLHGDFSSNLEHPMLMKSLIALSLAAGDSWNRGPGRSHPLPEEVTVRLPNIIFGALTAVVLFLLAQEFFGVEIGLLTAFLWSIGTIAIMDNRLAKEDTLLVFFTWLAYYFYVRAKKAATASPQQAAKYYGASGASFGLMLASKYFPHYLGLNCLYHYLFGKKQQRPPLQRRDLIFLLGACALFFVLFNPLVLLPNTLHYMLHYAGEGTMTHHGYLMMGRFYYNDPAHLQGGMPIYFYPLLLAVKTPLPVLGAFLVGLTEVWRRRREPGPSFLLFMFLFWIVPFSLLSAKWLRYMLAWMPTVYMIAALGLAKILSWSSVLTKKETRRWLAPALAGALAVVFLLRPAWVSAKSGPYYSLYLNPLGAGRVGYYFPHDEVNDIGLREAIQQICEQAHERSTVGGEAAPVFAYYFRRFGRDDLRYFDLSDQVKRVEAPPNAYLVIQDGRKYFENIAFIERVESYQTPVRTIQIGGAHAARVYRDEAFAELRVGR